MPLGHIPPGAYDVPHFDIHFYIEPIEDVFAIRPGPCGPEFVACDQFETAMSPLPPELPGTGLHDYTVSMEGFVGREASPPDPIPAPATAGGGGE